MPGSHDMRPAMRESQTSGASAPPTMEHGGMQMARGGHNSMLADFRRRFWVSLALTIPILVLSPAIQQFLGLDG